MIDIEQYLYDGANWQASAVLAYLRNSKSHILEKTRDKDHPDHYRCRLHVGRYENCREQGYVFSIWMAGRQHNYAVYEHRNSDQLIVLISNVLTLNVPSINDMWHDKGENPSKYDYDKAFEYGEIVECGEWIEEDMRKTIDSWLEGKKPEE